MVQTDNQDKFFELANQLQAEDPKKYAVVIEICATWSMTILRMKSLLRLRCR
jgi:hypothetical protein